jgi:hypothetical protein
VELAKHNTLDISKVILFESKSVPDMAKYR